MYTPLVWCDIPHRNKSLKCARHRVKKTIRSDVLVELLGTRRNSHTGRERSGRVHKSVRRPENLAMDRMHVERLFAARARRHEDIHTYTTVLSASFANGDGKKHDLPIICSDAITNGAHPSPPAADAVDWSRVYKVLRRFSALRGAASAETKFVIHTSRRYTRRLNFSCSNAFLRFSVYVKECILILQRCLFFFRWTSFRV